MVMSFAHGSNDVANAMGPFSAVFYIWENKAVPTKAPVCSILLWRPLTGPGAQAKKNLTPNSRHEVSKVTTFSLHGAFRWQHD